MASNLIPIISIISILITATEFPITPASANVVISDQTLYNSPPPPEECPYPCLPPPTTPANCPPPPPSSPHSGSNYQPPPPPPPGSGYYYYPPPSGYFPFLSPPFVNFPAPPPPNPILPYFPFYRRAPPSASVSSPLHHNGATVFMISVLVLLGLICF